LNINTTLNSIRRQALNENYFENLIQKYFIDNKHVLRVILNPFEKKIAYDFED
jgi:Zn-dependent M16 (insulinase) family peptidase